MSQQIENLRSNLLQALIAKEEAQASLDKANEQVKQIRLVLAGIDLASKDQPAADPQVVPGT